MSFKANPALLKQLIDMGYSKNCSTRGLYNTGNNDITHAVEWIIDHQGDRDVELPLVVPAGRGGGRGMGVPDDDVPAEIAAMEAYLSEGSQAFLDEGDFHKMVIVVNTELTVGTGKVSAQVAHAALGTVKSMKNNAGRWGESQSQWEQYGETLVVLKGRHPQHLLDLRHKAERHGLCQFLVQDAGKTEVTPGSITALGIFGKNDKVDQVTGDLPLLD